MNKIKLEKYADGEKFKKFTHFMDFFMRFANL